MYITLLYSTPFSLDVDDIRDRPFNLKKGGGGGGGGGRRIWFFVSFRKKNSDNTRVRIYYFFVTQSPNFFSRM